MGECRYFGAKKWLVKLLSMYVFNRRHSTPAGYLYLTAEFILHCADYPGCKRLMLF